MPVPCRLLHQFHLLTITPCVMQYILTCSKCPRVGRVVFHHRHNPASSFFGVYHLHSFAKKISAQRKTAIIMDHREFFHFHKYCKLFTLNYVTQEMGPCNCRWSVYYSVLDQLCLIFIFFPDVRKIESFCVSFGKKTRKFHVDRLCNYRQTISKRAVLGRDITWHPFH